MARLAIDRLNTEAAVRAGEDAEHAMDARAQPLDDLPFVGRGTLFASGDAGQHAFAAADGTGRILASRHKHDDGRGCVLVPLEWAAEELTVGVLAEHLQHRDFRQLAGRHERLLAALLDRAFLLQLAQDPLKRLTVGAFHAQRSRQIALAVPGVAGEISQDRLPGQGRFGISFWLTSHGLLLRQRAPAWSVSNTLCLDKIAFP